MANTNLDSTDSGRTRLGSVRGKYLSAEEFKRFSRRDGRRAMAAIILSWSVIAAAVAVPVATGVWWLYPLSVVIIAGRQHALAVLVHDGAHYLLTSNRRSNDLLSDLWCAFPLFVATSLYRRHHFEHHRHLNSERDPDLDPDTGTWTRGRWVRVAIGDITGVNFFKAAGTAAQWSIPSALASADGRAALGWAEIARYGLFLSLVLTITAVTDGWLVVLLFWIVPLLTVLNFIFRLRSAAEHVGCANEHELNAARTVRAGWAARALISPCNINYHIEHHLYPGIPFHRLGAVHRHLCTREDYRSRARICDSYLLGRNSVLSEIVRVP